MNAPKRMLLWLAGSADLRISSWLRHGIAFQAFISCAGSIAAETTTFTYDALGRLTKSVRADGPNDGKKLATCFDQGGNRLTHSIGPGAVTACAVQTPSPAPTPTPTSAAPPSFSVSNGTAVTEGGTLVFTVTKAGSAAFPYSINYATASTDATADTDYTPSSGTLTFQPGETSRTVSVATINDTVVESPETVLVRLSGETFGALVTQAQGSGTINDNDLSPPSFAIANASDVSEGASLVFTVTKAGTTNASFSVNYLTSGGTAVSGTDFVAAFGTLTFATSDLTKSISVVTLDDSGPEARETMTVSLSAPTGGATISTAQATGGMTDNDPGNHPPVANPDDGLLAPCDIASINVVANDTDPDGNGPLYLTSASSGAALTVGLDGTTNILVESHELAGPKGVTYTVSDNLGASATGTLTVTVGSGGCG